MRPVIESSAQWEGAPNQIPDWMNARGTAHNCYISTHCLHYHTVFLSWIEHSLIYECHLQSAVMTVRYQHSKNSHDSLQSWILSNMLQSSRWFRKAIGVWTVKTTVSKIDRCFFIHNWIYNPYKKDTEICSRFKQKFKRSTKTVSVHLKHLVHFKVVCKDFGWYVNALNEIRPV